MVPASLQLQSEQSHWSRFSTSCCLSGKVTLLYFALTPGQIVAPGMNFAPCTGYHIRTRARITPTSYVIKHSFDRDSLASKVHRTRILNIKYLGPEEYKLLQRDFP